MPFSFWTRTNGHGGVNFWSLNYFFVFCFCFLNWFVVMLFWQHVYIVCIQWTDQMWTLVTGEKVNNRACKTFSLCLIELCSKLGFICFLIPFFKIFLWRSLTKKNQEINFHSLIGQRSMIISSVLFWFCDPKRERLVHLLQPLQAVTFGDKGRKARLLFTVLRCSLTKI